MAKPKNNNYSQLVGHPGIKLSVDERLAKMTKVIPGPYWLPKPCIILSKALTSSNHLQIKDGGKLITVRRYLLKKLGLKLKGLVITSLRTCGDSRCLEVSHLEIVTPGQLRSIVCELKRVA